jgi:predicted RNA-binding protein
MCLMTVQFVEECGGAVVMKDVVALAQQADAVEVTGLIDGMKRVHGVRIVAVDFRRGITRLAPVAAR